MRIGIDLDDVLADFISMFTAVANAKFGRPELGTKPVDWAWSNFGLSKEEQEEVWGAICSAPNFWERLAVENGASYSSMEKLRSRKDVDLVFITARAVTAGNSVQEQSCRWLLNNFGVPFPTVIVDTNKGPLAAALKLDYFIDDRPKNCWEIQDAVPTCKVFLKNSSHNVNQDLGYRPLERIEDFDAFVKEALC
jgi:5'(3')-deoxyribonucleotidase